MSVHAWKSIRVVLDDLADTLDTEYWDEVVAIENCARAMQKLRVYPSLEETVSFISIVDHKGILPKGLIKINQVAAKLDFFFTQEQIEQLKRELDTKDQLNGSNFVCSIINNPANFPFFNTCNFQPVRLATNHFANSIHDSTCLSLSTECMLTYTVSPRMILTTSFRNGCLAVSYTRYPRDECGDFLIPDDQDYIDALKVYCMMRIWEQRWNMKEQGSSERLNYYKDRWNIMIGKVKGKLMMPSLDQLENLRTERNRLIPVERRYNSFFGNMGVEENVQTNSFLVRKSRPMAGFGRVNLPGCNDNCSVNIETNTACATC